MADKSCRKGWRCCQFSHHLERQLRALITWLQTAVVCGDSNVNRYHRIKDDRMENSKNVSRYRHNLLQRGGCARRYGPAPPHSPPSSSSTPTYIHRVAAVCCTNSRLLKQSFAAQQCYFEMKPIYAPQFSIPSSLILWLSLTAPTLSIQKQVSSFLDWYKKVNYDFLRSVHLIPKY